jgi:hypothetical protein
MASHWVYSSIGRIVYDETPKSKTVLKWAFFVNLVVSNGIGLTDGRFSCKMPPLLAQKPLKSRVFPSFGLEMPIK